MSTIPPIEDISSIPELTTDPSSSPLPFTGITSYTDSNTDTSSSTNIDTKETTSIHIASSTHTSTTSPPEQQYNPSDGLILGNCITGAAFVIAGIAVSVKAHAPAIGFGMVSIGILLFIVAGLFGTVKCKEGMCYSGSSLILLGSILFLVGIDILIFTMSGMASGNMSSIMLSAVLSKLCMSLIIIGILFIIIGGALLGNKPPDIVATSTPVPAGSSIS